MVLIVDGNWIGHQGMDGNAAKPLTERLAELARVRRPDDDALPDFLRAYYRDLPDFDVDERSDDDLYAAAARHWDIGETRTGDAIEVEVFSPERVRDGWHSDRSIVLIVTSDAPFLVDTVRIVLERHQAATHLLVHPVLRVGRDQAGLIYSIERPDDPFVVEAWTQVEIDRCDDDEAEALRSDLVAAITVTQLSLIHI